MKTLDIKISRALISVSDKSGIIEFAKKLVEHGVEIISTGGTYALINKNNIPVTEISDYTGFPEMMDGRLKTLHPKVHGGILGRRGVDDQTMEKHQIKPIDMVIVNLYPFQEVTSKPECDLATAIENIDIGGPTMLRAAAKNNKDVAVVVNSSDYQSILDEMQLNEGALSGDTRFNLAVKAFEHTAQYDGAIANHLGLVLENGKSAFPRTISTQYHKAQDMRYGENPHQKAAFYREQNPAEASVATATQIQGKELSYNNVADTDAALECVKPFAEPACVIVKHANPCGVALGADISDAYNQAFSTDPTSAFGGIIAFNRELDKTTAQSIIDRQFVEVIIAPTISEEAKIILAAKTNIRVLSCGELALQKQPRLDFKRVNGGLLVQDTDIGMVNESELKMVTTRTPTEAELSDLLFAWEVAKFVKSNAIVYARNSRTIGVGAGQMSRIYSARIAGIKAEDEGLTVPGSVMASDAFFPFRDGIDAAAKAGITAVIQPGGSMRDEEVIAAANEHDMAMVFTGMRHFKH